MAVRPLVGRTAGPAGGHPSLRGGSAHGSPPSHQPPDNRPPLDATPNKKPYHVVYQYITISSSSHHHRIIIASSSHHHRIIIASSPHHHRIIIASSSHHPYKREPLPCGVFSHSTGRGLIEVGGYPTHSLF